LGSGRERDSARRWYKEQENNSDHCIAFLAASDDVALIKLQQPVTDVAPLKIYRGSGERGQVVGIIGAGATGNGLVGQGSRAVQMVPE